MLSVEIDQLKLAYPEEMPSQLDEYEDNLATLNTDLTAEEEARTDVTYALW